MVDVINKTRDIILHKTSSDIAVYKNFIGELTLFQFVTCMMYVYLLSLYIFKAGRDFSWMHTRYDCIL